MKQRKWLYSVDGKHIVNLSFVVRFELKANSGGWLLVAFPTSGEAVAVRSSKTIAGMYEFLRDAGIHVPENLSAKDDRSLEEMWEQNFGKGGTV